MICYLPQGIRMARSRRRSRQRNIVRGRYARHLQLSLCPTAPVILACWHDTKRAWTCGFGCASSLTVGATSRRAQRRACAPERVPRALGGSAQIKKLQFVARSSTVGERRRLDVQGPRMALAFSNSAFSAPISFTKMLLATLCTAYLLAQAGAMVVVTKVDTAQALANAIERGDAHVHITDHLDLRGLPHAQRR